MLTNEEIKWAEEKLDLVPKNKAVSYRPGQAVQRWLAGEDGNAGGRPARPNQPYAQVDVVFACIEALISGVQGMPLMLSTADERIIESGPIYDFLFGKNPLTFEQFIVQTVGHYALTRDVFWVMPQGTKELYVVSGLQMRAVTYDGTADGELSHWLYGYGKGQKALQPHEVHQVKNFNPYDKFHGLGPLRAASLAISQAYQAALFNEASLANGAEPGAILSHPGRPTTDEVDLIRGQFNSRHRGAANAKKTALLTGGMDIKTIAMNMVDMQVSELRTLNDARICAVFGVPPECIGLVTEAQYSQGPAQKDFINNTILPLCSMLAGEITSMLSTLYVSDAELHAVDIEKSVSFYGSRNLAIKPSYKSARWKAASAGSKLFAWFDTTVHPVVQESQREVAEKVFKFREAGIPTNNLIDAHDLPYEKYPWNDHHWLSMGQLPAEYILDAGPDAITGPSAPEGEQEEEDKKLEVGSKKLENSQEKEISKKRIWQNWVASWQPLEKEYIQSLRVLFVRQEKELIKKLKAAYDNNKSVKADEDIIGKVTFDLQEANGKLNAINQNFWSRATELGTRQAAAEILGLSGKPLAEFAEAALREPAIKASLLKSARNLSGVNQFTQQKVANSLREGLKNEESLNDLVKRVQKQLSENRARALRIARTQTGGAVSAGRHTGMKAAGVELKGWLTSRDSNVRDSHKLAEQLYGKGIPVDQPFILGGAFLMHPGDPGAPVGEIVNCRCVEIAIKVKGKDYGIDHYQFVKFYNCDNLKEDLKAA